MSRIIGCRDLHIAKLTKDELGKDKPAYDTITRVPSVINVSIKDNVETSSFYSDDTVEQAFNKVSGKEVEIELGYLSTALEALITGKTVNSDGVLEQKGDDAAAEVALLFRAPKSKGGAFRYVCLYKGTLSNSDTTYETQEDKTSSATVKLTGTFIPLTCNGKFSAIADSDDTGLGEDVISKWFTTVYGSEAPAPTKQ